MDRANCAECRRLGELHLVEQQEGLKNWTPEIAARWKQTEDDTIVHLRKVHVKNWDEPAEGAGK